MKNKLKILIATGELGQLRYYEEVAIRLKNQGYDVAYCCDRDDPGVPEKIKKSAEQHGFGFFLHEGNQQPGELGFLYSFRKFLDKLGKHKITQSELQENDIALPTLEVFYRYHFYRLQEAKKIIDSYKPDIILTGEDGIASNYWLLTVAKQKKCKIATLPYGLANSTYLISKGVVEQHSKNTLRTSAKKSVQLIQKYHPKWVKTTEYGDVIYLPEEFILAVEKLGIKFNDPWCCQGGVSDLILIENEFMRKRYLAEGVSLNKIKIIGSVYCDILYEVFKRNQNLMRSYNKFSKVDESTTILICLPSDDHEGWGHRCEFKSLVKYVEAIQKYFSQYENIKIYYSFHPRMALSDRKKIEALGIHDYDGFPVYLIPQCDLMVISSSSLARWALVARKIVVNFDIYQFGINNFPEIPAYCQVTNFNDFKEVVRKVITKPSWFQSVVESSKEYSDLLGPIDGTALVELDKQLKQLCSKKKLIPELVGS